MNTTLVTLRSPWGTEWSGVKVSDPETPDTALSYKFIRIDKASPKSTRSFPSYHYWHKHFHYLIWQNWQIISYNQDIFPEGDAALAVKESPHPFRQYRYGGRYA